MTDSFPIDSSPQRTDLRPESAGTRALADQLAKKIVEAIVADDFPVGAQLPPEAQLASLSGVSRLTAREAIKALVAKNVVRIERGRGTFVNSMNLWSPLDPQLLAARAASGDSIRSLLEARRCIESAAAELCAERRSDSDLEDLSGALERMRESGDSIDTFVSADLAFHQTIMRASGNEFLAALMQPIEALVVAVRRLTSLNATSRENAIAEHESILAAIRSGKARKAESAMRAHLERTMADVARENDEAGDSNSWLSNQATAN